MNPTATVTGQTATQMIEQIGTTLNEFVRIGFIMRCMMVNDTVHRYQFLELRDNSLWDHHQR